MSAESVAKALSNNQCTVEFGDVEVGESYPLYGMITKFLDDRPGSVVAEINHNILVKFDLSDPKNIERLKERAFDPGIFVCQIISKNPQISGFCSTVVFGKRSNFNA